MNRLRQAVLCTSENFRKWKTTPRIWMIGIVILAFGLYDYPSLSLYARDTYGGMSSWILPFMFPTPTMVMTFGCMTTAFFCNAPFADRHMPFLAIRIGRMNWILGQVLYVILAAAVYVGWYLLVSLICQLPNFNLSNEWGEAVRAMAAGQSPPSEYHVTISMRDLIVDYFTPVEATLTALFLMWGVSVFIGFLVMMFNIISGGTLGVAVAGVMIFLTYFSTYFGQNILGGMIFWILPFSWCTIYGVNFWDIPNAPTFSYVVSVLIFASLVMAVVSAVVFCWKDMHVPKEEF